MKNPSQRRKLEDLKKKVRQCMQEPEYSDPTPFFAYELDFLFGIIDHQTGIIADLKNQLAHRKLGNEK